MYRENFAPGEVIFREGEAGDSAYVIETGAVEISALRKGKRVALATLEDGDLFGEMALVDDQVRLATATAVEETEAVVIGRDRVKDEMRQAGPLVDLFLRVILDRLRSTHGLMLRYKLGLATGELELPPEEPSYEDSRKKAMSTLQLERKLQEAIDEGQFEMHYQAIVDLRAGDVAGFEALIRWRHPEDGLVAPGRFIGLAESTGLIVPIGIWALEDGCRALARFRDACDGERQPPFVSINVSGRQLLEPGLVAELPRILDRTGIDPSRLKLEITESVLVDDPDLAIVVLERIKELGINLVVDDFGTGYSSLSYLYRFPIDTLKIDRSFVSTMGRERASRLIVRAVSSLAHSLELDVVAEGIEDDDQRESIRGMGCEYGQGYLFSKPVPEKEAVTLL